MGGAYKVAVEKSKLESMPTFLALTRQALPNLPNSSIENVEKGAYAVVECDSRELIRAQPASYKDALLPKGVPTMSVEAAITMGWGEWADAFVGINVFGASAPGGTCMDKFGFNVSNVVSCAEKCMKGETGVLSDGSQGKH